jgi:HAD superfamily hydrolase (TIGR01549 family)
VKEINIDKDWQKYKAVIFDVDGTVFDLQKMHRYIFLELFKYYLFRPWLFKDILVIYFFRKEREKLSESGAGDIANKQYNNVAKKLKLKRGRVEAVIKKWMSERPLDYIEKCRLVAMEKIIINLRAAGIKIIYFSDYDPLLKIKKLGLPYDYCFDASGAEIDALKPSAKGLEVILEKLNLKAGECLLVGDRQSKEGEAAEQIGLEYVIIK